MNTWPSVTVRNKRLLQWLGFSGRHPVTQPLGYWFRSVWWRLTGK